MPLGAVPAVSLDTETTGLDVSDARIIEIGCILVDGGNVHEDRTFSSLVNPGRKIPEQSRLVHGIADKDVAEAKAFPAVMEKCVDFTGPRLVIGYSIGFDMAILKAEHERNGLRWTMPRCLDIAHLVRILNPSLPAQSLDITAEWLSISVVDRHRALSDARMCGKILLALLPKLRERGIRTLAQAERASLRLSRKIDEEVDAGWEVIVAEPRRDRRRTDAYARIDSFPYRNRVSDVMSSPVVSMPYTSSLEQALATLVDEKISSVLVEGPDGKIGGILTERDILNCIRKGGPERIGKSLEFALRKKLVTIESREFVYRALLRMSEHEIRHLVATDEAGVPVGIMSSRNLLHQRADEALSLGDKIEGAASAEELGRVWKELVNVAQALSNEDVAGTNIAAIISRELRALTKQACLLAEERMRREGQGEPPAEYDVLVLGSGGRGESLLAMDQDNAIVFAEGESGSETDLWLGRFGTIMSDILDSVGLSYCKGGVMASANEWRKDIGRWRETVKRWLGNSSAKNILNSDIFFDAACVHGKGELAGTLRREALGLARNSPTFLKFLDLNASEVQSPFGLMGNLKTKDKRLDLKMHGLMPIFSAARALALRHGYEERSTQRRLQRYAKDFPDSKHLVDNLAQAHQTLLTFVLHQQLADIINGAPVCNSIEVKSFSDFDQNRLKWSLSRVQSIPDLLKVPMGV